MPIGQFADSPMSRYSDRSRALKASVIGARRLTPLVRDEMYALFARHYVATSRPQFDDDLAAKDHVVVLHDAAGRLRGFSTLAVSTMTLTGRVVRIVFSGDTIIDPQSWGSPEFAFAWLRAVGRLAAEKPELPLYWLLIVKGHRTYRFMPAFGLRFVPDWRQPDDASLTALKDEIAQRYFGSAYDPSTGIVACDTSRGYLAPELAIPSDRERARADVRFFLERNPGYTKGDELVCLCALQVENMRPLTQRLFLQGFTG